MSERILSNGKTILCHGDSGLQILVDEEDYPLLSRWKWYPMRVRDTEKHYARRNLQGGGSETMHQLIMGTTPRNMVIDHINDNGLDNRKGNLRYLPNSENIRRKYEANPYTGIRLREDLVDNPWKAEISFGGKTIHVGYFHSADAARYARDQKLEELLAAND